ncbi:T9SS type A sorting domain-containing protein [Flavihumibacter profundi]|uniref:T9SS type A sorting domain-containing protein n=1 Tax=Flavihumibacter profundi TaxID=2716883 RepID=UPI001CC80AFA|nr:T9SS type A sorting domain-containing protein [Flavihumibacter profundi]MBZ5858941.1 T9SS type A sorting domain-containing protein [Flavihumibacter profundi]
MKFILNLFTLVLVLAATKTGLAQQQSLAGENTNSITVLPIRWAAPLCTKIPGNKNRITWTVAETVDTKTFEVQRSGNGKDFSIIGSVAATAQTISGAFIFEDVQPLAIAYYRICSVDVQGKKMYSPEIKALSQKRNTSIRQSLTETIILFGDSEKRLITLLNISGQQLSNTVSTSNQYSIKNNSLKKGIYLLKIDTEGLCEVQKFMVL